MGLHHIALATKDADATIAFYTEVMGFELAKVVVAPTPGHTGWARHFFFATGPAEADGTDAGMIAFWELHDETIGDDYRADLSKSLGLPQWVNHLAFDAPTLEVLADKRERWRRNGITVAEIDHDFCTSIYATDPNGIMIEFCTTTRPFTDEERSAALRSMADPSPTVEPEPPVTFYEPYVAEPVSV